MDNNIYQFEVNNIDLKKVSLSDFKDKTLLIVNVASACGFTPQYTGLQYLYEKYKDKGFEILEKGEAKISYIKTKIDIEGRRAILDINLINKNTDFEEIASYK